MVTKYVKELELMHALGSSKIALNRLKKKHLKWLFNTYHFIF